MAKKIRVWDGSAWQDVAPALPYTAVHSAQASMPSTAVDGQIWLDTDGTLAGQDFVPLTGGTMTGNLNTPSINSGGISAKNYVINGGFDIWQRGTSLTPAVTTFTSYQADRWSTYSAANWTVSRQLTNDTTNLPNIQYCGRFQRNVGNTATTICQIQNVFETANSIPLAGKTVTLSYYARRGADYSAVGNSFTVSIYIGTSTDAGIGSFTSASVAGGVAGALTTTWQRFTVTAAIPSTVTQIAIYTAYNPTGTAGANDYFEITGVQLEPGSVATPFSRNGSTIQGELAECERYYEVIGGTSTAGITIGGVATGASQAFYFPYSFRTTKRTTPTLSKTGTWGVSNSIQPQTVFPQPSGFTIYGQSLASGAWYSQADSAAATIIASAEL
jgi:hypothetical protein